ncbi:subtilisin-like protein [Martensiomyces pterosporus]|nr:subtilisin-like protein [Martensiomyces pterosporus]
MRILASGVLFAVAYFGQQSAAQPTSTSEASGSTPAANSSVPALPADEVVSLPISKVVSYPPNIPCKPGTYIVELEENAGFNSFSSVTSSFSSIPQVKVDRQYTNIFNGFSITANSSFDPAQLASIPGIKRVWPAAYRSTPFEPSAQNITFPFLHQQTGVARVIQELGFTGKGIKIGIVDSGVDYNHPELGNCWKTPGCPWQYGYDFIGDKFNSNTPNPIIAPGPVPMDCSGHGTHVSGIIGARGPKVQGVATGATLGMYRVFSCPVDGRTMTSDDIILSGIEAAFKDGHNIISLSLGGGGWPEDPLSVACSKIAAKGVVVVVANGNNGNSGLYTAGSPAVGRGVISVGSVDNWNNTGNAAIITTSKGSMPVQFGSVSQNVTFVFEQDVPLVVPLDSTNSTLGCAALNVSLAGKIALFPRGTCTFAQKAQNAQNAGAIGVLISNNVDGTLAPTVGPPVTIPVVGINQADGQYIVDSLSKGSVTIRAPKYETIVLPGTNGGGMSSFSSYGPSPELDIAPLISAPGGNIFSTYPLKLGGYASLSGTSMSAPYISGTVALLKQARPELTAKQIREALITTARPITDAINGKKVHPYQSGAGLVNIYSAITSRAIISPPALALNDSNWGWLDKSAGFQPNFPTRWAMRTITITNTDRKKWARISFENLPAESISAHKADGTFAVKPRVWPETTANVDKSTLPQVYSPDLSLFDAVFPGQSRRITVFIVAPYGLKESDRWFYGGFLNFTLKWDGETRAPSNYVVPYAGYNGNYRKSDVLSVPSEGLPSITDMQGNAIANLTSYGATEAKPLAVNYRLEVPSRIVSLTLLDSRNKTLGYLPYGYYEYVIRNYEDPTLSTSGALVNGIVYNDTKATQQVRVPAGLYHVRLVALRPFGRAKVKADYQVWDSPVLSIA